MVIPARALRPILPLLVAEKSRRALTSKKEEEKLSMPLILKTLVGHLAVNEC